MIIVINHYHQLFGRPYIIILISAMYSLTWLVPKLARFSDDRFLSAYTNDERTSNLQKMTLATVTQVVINDNP